MISGPGKVYIDGVYVGTLLRFEEYVESTRTWDGLKPVPISRTIDLHISAPLEPPTAARPGWRDYFLGFARAASVRGECTRRKVGAVVVKDKRVVGTGYNGAPKGALKTCLTGDCPRANSGAEPGSSYDTGAGACIAIHAEANAIIDAGRRNCEGAKLYLTDPPCDGCKKLIASAGIRKVIWPGGEWKVQ